jgi:hypothetical protein
MDQPHALAKAASQSDAIDALEREKFEFDKEQKLAEAARLAQELKIKQRESARSRWTNPFVVAIICAPVVGLGNIAVSVLNSRNQRELAETTNQNLGYLESRITDQTRVKDESVKAH